MQPSLLSRRLPGFGLPGLGRLRRVGDAAYRAGIEAAKEVVATGDGDGGEEA